MKASLLQYLDWRTLKEPQQLLQLSFSFVKGAAYLPLYFHSAHFSFYHHWKWERK